MIQMPVIAAGVDYCWQNVNAQSLIGVMNQSKTIVEKDGSLSSAPWRFSFHPVIPGESSQVSTTQSLDAGYRPIVRTFIHHGGIRYGLLAFGARINDFAADMVRVELRNLASRPLAARLRVEIRGTNALRTTGNEVISGKQLIAVVDKPASGRAEIQIVRHTWGNVSGWNAQSNWASPKAPADAAFRNITVGWGGKPVIYRFKAKPGAGYRVVMGFCEGYWSQPGKRVLDVSLDGHLLKTLDPIRDAGHDIPALVCGMVKAPADGWLTARVDADKAASDKNTILNVIWVFPAKEPVDLDALKEGHSGAKPSFYVDCGSASDQRLDSTSINLSADLGPGDSSTFWLRFPHDVPVEDRKPVARDSGESVLNATRSWWDNFFARGAQFIVPDAVVNAFYRASLTYSFLLRDKIGHYYVVKPGATIYNAFWYRDGAYISHAHDIAGYPGEAERDLRVFVHRPLPQAVNTLGTAPIEQEANGAWDAPRNEWDGQGQALWAIVSHYELTRDRTWLRKAYPAIRRGALWIRHVREASKQPQDIGTDHFGLLPRGHGEAIGDGIVYYHDFWGVLGIREAAIAAEALQKKKDAAWMQNEADDFRRCLIADVRKSQLVDDQGLAYIPGTPGSPARPNQQGANIWGDIAALYPCEAMNPQDPLVTSTFERMWNRRLQDEYQYLTHRKIWTYITADWIQALWLRGQCRRALQLFWGYLNHAYTTKCWIEEMYPDTRVGTGDQPHGWAAANLVALVRNMLVREEGTRLNLLYGIPGQWLAQDQPIVVNHAPTTLGGPVSFKVQRDRESGNIMVHVSRAPGGATALRVWLPGFHIQRVIQVQGPPPSVSAAYMDVPPQAGNYEVVVAEAKSP